MDAKDLQSLSLNASSPARGLLAPQAQAAVRSHQHVLRPALGMTPYCQSAQYEKSSLLPSLHLLTRQLERNRNQASGCWAGAVQKADTCH